MVEIHFYAPGSRDPAWLWCYYGNGRNRAAKTISCTSARRTHVLHQAGLRADEQECILAELPSRDYRSGFGPEVGPIIRFSSITVAGAAPDWPKKYFDAPASRYSDLQVGNT
jgi:hypothetical protein